MPKASVAQTNFTAGEISPRLRGRVDIAKYANAAKRLFNTLPTIYGGARKRHGSRLLDCKGDIASFGDARMLPFVFDDDVYLVLINSSTIRVIDPEIAPSGSTTPVITPTGSATISTAYSGINYAQGGDTMFLFNTNLATLRLLRFAAAQWAYETVPWDPPPADDVGEICTATAASATTGTVTLTSAFTSFVAADVGRYYTDRTGRALITAYTSATQVTAVVEVTLKAGTVNLTRIYGAPNSTLTPSAVGTVGQTITLTASADTFKSLVNVSHIGAMVEINGGLVQITAIASATSATAKVYRVLSSIAAAPAKSWRLLFNPWNAVDKHPRCGTFYQQRLYVAGTVAQPQTFWGTVAGEYYNFAQGVDDDDAFSFEIASDQYNPIKHLTTFRDLIISTTGGEFLVQGGIETPVSPTNIRVVPQTTYGCADVRPIRIGQEMLFAQLHAKKVRSASFVDIDVLQSPDVSVLAEHLLRVGIKRWAYAAQPESIIWMLMNDGTLVSMSYDREQDVFAFAQHQMSGATLIDLCVLPFNGADRLFVYLSRGGRNMIEYFDDDVAMEHFVEVLNPLRTATLSGSGTITATTVGHGLATNDRFGMEISPGSWGTFIVASTPTADTFTFSGSGIQSPTTWRKAQISWNVGTNGYSGADSQSLSGQWFSYQPNTGTWDYRGDITTNGSGVLSSSPNYYVGIRFGIKYASQIITLPTEIGSAEGTAQGNASSIHEIVVRLNDSMGGSITLSGNPESLPRQLVPVGGIPGTFDPTNNPANTYTGDHRITGIRGWGNTGSGDWDGSITFNHNDATRFEILSIIKKLTSNQG